MDAIVRVDLAADGEHWTEGALTALGHHDPFHLGQDGGDAGDGRELEAARTRGGLDPLAGVHLIRHNGEGLPFLLAARLIDAAGAEADTHKACCPLFRRHERMHRTLKADTLKPPAATLRQQQAVFERFRDVYNSERPHEALGNKPPASVYQPSAKAYPTPIRPPEYDSDATVCRVYDKGSFCYQGRSYFLADVLGGKQIALVPSPDDKQLDIYYRHVRIALLDLEHRQLRPAPKRKKEAFKGEEQENK